jgi:hypothetical protein
VANVTTTDREREAPTMNDCIPDYPCDMDEWIPCEAHSTAVVIREGASMRTGDELSECFVLDALDLGAEMPECWESLWAEIQEALRHDSWIGDIDLGGTLSDICTLSAEWLRSVEGHDYLTRWDDGYVIYDITGGPLLG